MKMIYNGQRQPNYNRTHGIWVIIMNLFFSPPVYSYSALVPHFKACEVADKLVECGFIEFELNPYDDSTDPYYLIYSRIRTLKHKVLKMLAEIQSKYQEDVRELSPEEKTITISRMKEYMAGERIDHLKYLDYEEHWLEEKIGRFNDLSRNYDNFLGVQRRFQEELDCLRIKLQICQNRDILDQFQIVTGICPLPNKLTLERLIFRKSRGHSIVSFRPRLNVENSSCVFICLINKNIFRHIGEKIVKACQCNEVNIYDLPNQPKHLLQYEATLLKKLKESDELIQISGQELTRVLSEHVLGDGISLRQHILRVSFLQRIVYIICHSKQIGEPSNHVLFNFHMPAGETLPPLGVSIFPLSGGKTRPRTIMPRLPCLFEANIMTELFSIPKHNEVMPSVFMLITVPVLFGMMFSDFGHGLLLLAVCIAFKLGPMFKLMAAMSIYCGIIYNQFFGMKILRWGNLGVVQPVWAVSENGLNFQNSLKMKLSMIMAFVHMGFGMSLKIWNEHKRGQHKKIIYDSLPKIGLLFTTVGYLVYLIITKWLTDFRGREATAPSIINSLLELYLGWNQSRTQSILGSMEVEKAFGSLLMKLNVFFLAILVFNHTLRHRAQFVLSGIYGNQKVRRRKTDYHKISDNIEDDIDIVDQQLSQQLEERKAETERTLDNMEAAYYYQKQDQQHNELGPLEVFEFVLGLISSTTSYLRLFALSLAHAKLSSLILELLLSSLSGPHPSVSLARCIVFFGVTVGMMLTLDVMECMMHVIRLHWVEWMGKFYTGSGVLFRPEIEQNFQ